MLMELFTFENLIALLTLTSLEIVLGIDNIVFIAILTGKLEKRQQALARRVGLILAMLMRILLLLTIKWVMQLTHPLFTVLEVEITGKGLILLGGGLFLIAKSTHEIHNRLEGPDEEQALRAKRVPSMGSAIAQIMVLDIVFSLDSVITAVGMVQNVLIMIIAIIAAVIIMLVFAGSVTAFIERHPSIKMLALSFLLLIGVMLIAEGFGKHIEKGYIYFAMAFSLAVEMLNIRSRKVRRA